MIEYAITLPDGSVDTIEASYAVVKDSGALVLYTQEKIKPLLDVNNVGQTVDGENVIAAYDEWVSCKRVQEERDTTNGDFLI